MSTYRLPFTADDVVALADKEVGVGEGGAGHNNNHNKFTAWYGVDTAWCAIFLMWLFDQAGLPNDHRGDVPWSAWVPTINSWARTHGQWVGPNDLRRGDWGLLDEPGGRQGTHEGDHVFLIRDRLGAGHYRTDEGNWANAVRTLERHADAGSTRIIGGYRPNYTPVKRGAHKPAFYRLKSGDTLSEVADKYGVSLQALVKLNAIPHPNDVRAGLCLAIPGGRVPTIALNLARKAVKQGHDAAPDTWTLLHAWTKDRQGDSLRERYSHEQLAQGYHGTKPGQDADGLPGMASLRKLAREHGWRAVAHK